MGKLSISEVEELRSSGILDEGAVKEMQDKGLVGVRKRGNKWFMTTKNKKRVYPTFYFQGLGRDGANYTGRMNELKNKFAELLKQYATEENTTK